MEDACVAMLAYLARRELNEQQTYGVSDKTLRAALVDTYQPMDEALVAHARNQFPERGDLYKYAHAWIYLPAPIKGPLRIPILNAIWDRRSEPHHTSFQLGVFYPADDEEFPLGRAWRFECPEGQDSVHSFYHAQPGQALRTLDEGEVPIPTADPAIPQGAPTIPVDACDEIGLLVALLIAVYGVTQTGDLVRTANVDHAEAALREMRSIR